MTTTPSAGGAIGTVLTDTVTLAGGASPTGTMDIVLFHGSCTIGHVELAQAMTVSGNGSYTTPLGFTTTAAGTYQWAVEYFGDAYNNDVTVACGEAVTIKGTPTLVTAASAGGSILAATAIHDVATLTGTSGVPGGTVTFDLYGPADTACAGAVFANPSIAVNGSGVATSANFIPTTATAGPGTYHWIARYSGDATYIAVNSTCSAEPVVMTP